MHFLFRCSPNPKHASALNGLLLEDGQLALTGLGCSLLREPLVAPMSPAANW